MLYTKAAKSSPRYFPYSEKKKRTLTFVMKAADVTYSQLRRGSIVLAVIVAAAVGYLKMRPML